MSTHLAPVITTAAYDVIWKFAAERQEIFHKRVLREAPPWTDDPILARYKFTNAYRASDRTSQYLIRRVIYDKTLPNAPEEVFFRIVLFKLFNSISTWELLEGHFERLTWAAFFFEEYDAVLSRAQSNGRSIYSSAYIMPPAHQWGHTIKHRNHLHLLMAMMADGLPHRLSETRTMQEGFELIKAYPSIGDFLAYQLITDINYSELVDYSEDEFVVPGPGAASGIKKCFSSLGGLSSSEVIRLMADRQEMEFTRLGISFRSLWGRRLKLIDLQNLLCEVDKYTRVSHPELQGKLNRKRIKHTFKPSGEVYEVWYPPKWGLNDKLPKVSKATAIQERLL